MSYIVLEKGDSRVGFFDRTATDCRMHDTLGVWRQFRDRDEFIAYIDMYEAMGFAPVPAEVPELVRREIRDERRKQRRLGLAALICG